MGSIDANACRPGKKLLIDGEPYSVVERAHHKPGKGGAFVRFKLKGVISGKVIDHTVRAGSKMEEADVTTRPMQYLYQQGDDFVVGHDRSPPGGRVFRRTLACPRSGFGSGGLGSRTDGEPAAEGGDRFAASAGGDP